MRGLGSQALVQPINIVMQLTTVPLLLHFWGVDLMGEWLVLTAIPAYLMLSDLGFISATINEMTMEVARDDRDAALRTFQSSGVMLGGMCLFIAVVAGAFAWAAPMADWFGFVHLTNADAGTVIALQIMLVICGIQAGLMNAGFVCEGHYGLGTLFMTGINFANFCMVILAAAVGFGPVGAATMMLATQLTGVTAMRIVLRRIAPWVEYGFAHATCHRIREILKPALGFVVYTFGQALNVQGILLVVGAVLGPSAVTVFNTTRMMVRFVNTLLSAYYSTVRPEIAMAYGKDDTALIRRLHDGACQVAIWLALCAAAGYALLGAWFLDLWTHGEVVLDPWLLAGLIAAMLFYAVWFASSMVFYGTNRHHGMSWALVIANAASVGVAYGLMLAVDLPGAGIAAAAAELVMLIYVLNRTLRILDEPLTDWLRAVLPPPVALIRTLLGRSKSAG